MFLPARMRRILIGGHRTHLEPAITLLQQEGVVHIEDYRDPTGTTTIGTPLEAGERASELLVSLRGLLKALGAEGMKGRVLANPDPSRTLAEADAASSATLSRLAGIRTDIAALEQEDAVLAPLSGLDLPLETTTGLRSVRILVGTTRLDPRIVVGTHFDLQAATTPGGFAVALVAPAAQAAEAERALAEAGFTPSAIPAGRSGTPSARRQGIAAELATKRAALQQAEAQVVELRAAWGPRLASLERTLQDEVDRTQAPLRFGVTSTTFHLEGWAPAESVARIQKAIAGRFGDSLYVHELGDAPASDSLHGAPAGSHGGRASGGVAGHATAAAPATSQGTHAVVGRASHTSATAVAVGAPKDPHGHSAGTDAHHGAEDAHHGHGPEDEPPIRLENKGLAKPYEFLLGLLGRPRYWEIDPTKLMLVFFPLFFGLMVGDVAVGIIIVLVGVMLKKRHLFGIGGPAVGRALVMGGVMSIVIGAFVFGEALGIHFVTPEAHDGGEQEMSWEGILGLELPHEGFLHKTGGHEVHAGDVPAEGDPGITTHQVEAHEDKGILTPHTDVHLSLNGWVNLGYYSKIHDIQALLVWSLLIGFVHLVLGLLIGVRNVYIHHGAKLAIQEKASWLTLIGGILLLVSGLVSGDRLLLAIGGGILVASVALLWAGTAHTLGQGWIALLEIPSLMGNLLSYTRLAAIGASKAGMVIALHAIGFTIAGGGALGWIIYLVGFACIIPLAILAGGLQSLRLQFVEFFQKFYTGGGRPYVPFTRRAT